MSSLLVIRLHPEEPILGDDFTKYLKGLCITAYELSFDDPDGSEPDSEIDNSAVYIAPYYHDDAPLTTVYNDRERLLPTYDDECQIVQHL